MLPRIREPIAATQIAKPFHRPRQVYGDHARHVAKGTGAAGGIPEVRVERYTHLSPTHKAEAVERIAQNSPTLSTTGNDRARRVSAKLAKRKGAPVAQVDRAAVS